jgi:ABC-type multidrug transport system ATPase subunit
MLYVDRFVFGLDEVMRGRSGLTISFGGCEKLQEKPNSTNDWTTVMVVVTRVMDIVFGPLGYATEVAGSGGADCCRLQKRAQRQHIECRATDVRLRHGTVTAILGGSGTGKSTLLKLLGRRLQPTQGEVQYFGLPTTVPVEESWWTSEPTAVAYVGETNAMLSTMTTQEVIEFALAMHSTFDRPARLRSLALALHLEHVLHVPVHALSMGQRQRLALAEAICSNPHVLLADAVTTAMTTYETAQVTQLLREMAKQGCTIVLAVNHPQGNLVKQVDNVVLLSAGRLICFGTPTACISFLQTATKDPHLQKARAPLDYALIRCGKASAQFQEHLMTSAPPMATRKPPAGPTTTNSSSGTDAKYNSLLSIDDSHTLDHDDIMLQDLQSFESEDDEEESDGNTSQGQRRQAQADALNAVRAERKSVAAATTTTVPATTSNGHGHGPAQRRELPPSWTTSYLQEEFARAYAEQRQAVGVGADSILTTLKIETLSAAGGSKTARPGFCSQLMLLLWRWFITSTREGAEVRSMLLGLLACALCMSLVWATTDRGQLQATYQVLQMQFLVLLFTILIPHAKVASWIEHRLVYSRQHTARMYSPVAYVVAQTVYSMLELAVLSAVFTLPVLYVVFPDATSIEFAWAYAFVTCHMLAHAAIVETFAFVTANQAQSHMYAINSLAFSVVFAGFLVPTKQLPAIVAWLSRLSYTQYAFTGLVRVFFHRSAAGGRGEHLDLLDDIMDVPDDTSVVETLVALALMMLLTRICFVLAVWLEGINTTSLCRLRHRAAQARGS